MKKLPIGIQTFREIIERDFLYIDKTEHINQLLTSGKYYFLSRPRRFGKSLLCSTIKEVYQGSKDLFKGLWIENQWDWSKTNPVIHLAFNEIGYTSLGLEVALAKIIEENARNFDIKLVETTADQKFRELIRKLSEWGKAVVIIDEYDKPIIDYFGEEDQTLAKSNQKVLKNFFSILKSSDPYLQLVFITGVSKFSHVSVFSDLNNLKDITTRATYASIVGYTNEELLLYFTEYMPAVIQANPELSGDELWNMIKKWYNGYSWDAQTTVYNPWSILNFFDEKTFNNFWFATGTPTFLVRFLKKNKIYKLDRSTIDKTTLNSYDLDNMNPFALLFQTGYLTIKEDNRTDLSYTLGFPNFEVELSFYSHLIGVYADMNGAESPVPARSLRKAFQNNELESVGDIINSLFKNIPSLHFAKQSEFLYHALLHMVFKALGLHIESEVHTSDGRIDAVVKTKTHIYLLEFKLNKSPEEALTQIIEKEYHLKYQLDGKIIIGIGINFNSEKKAVDGIIWENL